MTTFMNYSLAKELKEAGFPYRKGTNSIHPRVMPDKAGSVAEGLARSVPVPDLSELFEACEGDIVLRRMGKQYIAIDEAGREGCGTEAEEAMGYLWLAQKQFNGNSNESEASE